MTLTGKKSMPISQKAAAKGTVTTKVGVKGSGKLAVQQRPQEQEPADSVYGGYELQIGSEYDLSFLGSEGSAVFQGTLRTSSVKGGLYWRADSKEFTLLEAADAKKVSAMAEIMEGGNDKGRRAHKDLGESEAPDAKKKTRVRLNPKHVLTFSVESEDDEMVSLVKNAINEKPFYIDQMLRKTSNASNLISGLRLRHTMTLGTFKIWADILEMDVIIELAPKA